MRIDHKIVVMVAVLAMSSPLYGQHETITIKSHSRSGKAGSADRAYLYLYADLDGRAVVLQCVLSHDDCKELARGEYNIERLLEGEGSYPNCPNVDLYRLGADSFKEEPLGEYCLAEHK